MDFPTFIVARGKVLTKVCPAAFLASERGTSNEARDGHEIEEPPRIRIAWRRIDAFRLLTIVGVELPDGVGQRGAGAEHAGLTPHDVADFGDGRWRMASGYCSILFRTISQTCRGRRWSALRRRKLRPYDSIGFHFRRCQPFLHRLTRARPEHASFEQRIARQAIGAVDTGAGFFAGGEQPWDCGSSAFIAVDA